VHEIQTGEAGASDYYIYVQAIDIWRDNVRIVRPSVV
jgi:hypothetical protein